MVVVCVQHLLRIYNNHAESGLLCNSHTFCGHDTMVSLCYLFWWSRREHCRGGSNSM